jgi:hypothetical protein
MSFRALILEQLFSTPAGTDYDVRNTLFFNILCKNPSLAIICADFFRRRGANPILIKDLEVRSGIFFNPDRFPKHHRTARQQGKNGKGPSMAINRTERVCTHIKVNGVRCGSPAMRSEVFCYFHQRMIRGVRTPPKSRLHPMALLEDPSSIQASLMEIINAVVRNQIDINRARVVLRALHIAVKNSRASSFDIFRSEMVNEIPEYPDAPTAAGPFATAVVQAQALAFIKTPPEEESEDERLSAAFYTAPVDPTRRKPPASIKKAVRRRSVNAVGAGMNASRPQPYQ